MAALPLLVLAQTASCADSDEAQPRDDDASATVQPQPDASTVDVLDAAPSCDAGDPDCVSTVLTCAEADFCPVPSAVDPRFILTSIWGTSANDVWAVGSGGTIVHWDGTTWKTVPSGTLDTLNVVWGTAATDIWVAASSNTILHATGLPSNAAEWTSNPAFPQCAQAFPGRMNAMWGPNALDVRVGGAPFACFDVDSTNGNLLRTRLGDAGADAGDAGGNWDVLAGFDGRWSNAIVHAMWGSSASDQWIALDNGSEEPWARGTLVHGIEPAAGDPMTWTSIDSQSSSPFESLWGSSASDVWAVGGNGTVRRFIAGAKQWAIVDVPTTNTLHAVWGTGANDVWAVGDAGTILHWDGAAWTAATVAFPLGRKPALTGIWGSAPNDVWVVGEAFALHFTGKKAAQ